MRRGRRTAPRRRKAGAGPSISAREARTAQDRRVGPPEDAPRATTDAMATSDARHTSEHGGTSPSAPGPSRRTCVEWAGRFLGPVGAIALYLALAPLAGTGAGDLPEVGRRVAAVTALMAILWVTEALPLAATAL